MTDRNTQTQRKHKTHKERKCDRQTGMESDRKNNKNDAREQEG